MVDGWKKNKLINLVSSITTGKLDANAMIPNGQYRFYTCAKDYYYIDKYAFDDEALLISGNGEYVGYIHYYKGKFNAYQRVYVITGFKIDVKYFQNYLNRYLPIRINKEVSQNNIPYIRLSTLSQMPINYPESRIEQTSIANILSKVDEAIASEQKSISTAERLKKSLMQNLLTGRMKPDGTFRKEDEFYLDEKFGKVPKGWEVKKVQDLSAQVTDGEHQTPERTDNGFYLISARNIKNGYLSLEDVDYIPEFELRRIQNRCNPQEGDILISCSGTIGNVCIVPEGFIGGMVRSVALVKLKKDIIEPRFAELMFQSHYLQTQMKIAVASSVQGNIFQGAIKRLKMFYPKEKQERELITQKLNSVGQYLAFQKDRITVLERLKKSLMQNLLTGKVRVNRSK